MPKSDPKVLLLVLLGCCLIAPISFSIGNVPFRFYTLAVFVSAAIAGKRYGTLITCAYLLIGAIGLPVFAGFEGGWEKLTGPTSGFLWGLLPVSFYVGWAARSQQQTFFHHIVIMFRAHLLWLIPGFAMLYLAYPGVDVFATLVRLLPDVMVKSLLGGILALGIIRGINT